MYKKSEKLLQKALNFIPLGSQTFSKSLTQYPKGISPFFIDRAKGSKVWDVDGRKYIDFVSSLASVTLGYCDEDVDNAIKKQMENGIIFSLPHKLEMEVAKKLIDIIPCASKVRFAKNGTDATSGAIRIARAYTNKEHIAMCGYHGWQDWSMASTTRDLGIPKSVKDLTHTFIYNDISSLEDIFNNYDIACVIMEPMNVEYPKNNFLKKVQSLAKKNNSLLVFDETITGFRHCLGGCGEMFDIIPDMATFGKGIANGMPLSVIAGSDEVMKTMEDIFFSSTFGGETLSLASTNAVIDKYIKNDVISYLKNTGEYLLNNLNNIIDDENLNNIFSTSGHPSWSFLHIKEQDKYTSFEIKTFFLQEMFKRNILTLGTHNLNYSHTKKDIDILLSTYKEVLPLIKKNIQEDTLIENINGDILKPLFKIR
jgi:glutamate-1-semialdehyde 2,1-aminomutase